MADQQLEQYKQKYQSVLTVIQEQQVRLAHMHVQDGKFFLQGEAPSEKAKNRVWDQIKQINPQYHDILADITVSPHAAAVAEAAPPAAPAGKVYTVQAGDSLSKISKQFYGDANQYMKIFEANRGTLSDPNKIRPGQVLQIP